ALQGVWIMEMGELSATKKADIEATKHFISKQEDIFRVAYGRHKSYFKRRCVFWGTTNDNEFLRDKTGNRRFWPVDVGIQ
ncbi:VapE domain-containing protein, partial [Enterococcus faecalis]